MGKRMIPRIGSTTTISGNTVTKTKGNYSVSIDLESYRKWQEGTLIQIAMPNLTSEEREFFISGITPDEWKEIFSNNNEEEDENV